MGITIIATTFWKKESQSEIIEQEESKLNEETVVGEQIQVTEIQETEEIINEAIQDIEIQKEVIVNDNNQIDENDTKITNITTEPNDNKQTSDTWVQDDMNAQEEKEKPIIDRQSNNEKSTIDNKEDQISIVKETKKEEKTLQCTDSKHYIDVGNSGMWFDSEEKAFAYYKELIKDWGDKLESFKDFNSEEYKIVNEEYNKSCPCRYEPSTCICGKVTIDFEYRE